MTHFNMLLVVLCAALVSLVLDACAVSAGLLVAALLISAGLKRRSRKEEGSDYETGLTLAAAVVRGMAWAQQGRVYQLDAGDDRDNPMCARIGRTVVDPLSGETLFLPEIAVGAAGFEALPALAQAAG